MGNKWRFRSNSQLVERTKMPKYKITMEVDYVVDADSLKQAMDLVDTNTEHPFIPFDPANYCDDTRVIGGMAIGL